MLELFTIRRIPSHTETRGDGPRREETRHARGLVGDVRNDLVEIGRERWTHAPHSTDEWGFYLFPAFVVFPILFNVVLFLKR